LPTIKRNNRRTIVTVSIMLGIALIGLVAINTDRAGAERLTNPPAALADGAGVGDEAASSEATYSLGTASPMGAVAKMLAALAFVILLVYGVLWFMRRMMGRRYGRKGEGRSLEVIESAYVGPHKTVSLVRVGSRSVLVGVTDTQVSILTELDADETEQLLARNDVAQPQQSFSGVLSTAAGKIRDFGLKRKITALES